MSSFEHIMISARNLLARPLDEHLEELFRRRYQGELASPTRVILREKDLADKDYQVLAERIHALCIHYSVTFMWQSHVELALRLSSSHSWIKHIQMPMSDFEHYHSSIDAWESCWVSVHSLAEALLAESMGASALIYGHIYASSCKPDSPPRGLSKLRDIIMRTQIPIYAIGGIDRLVQCRELQHLGCAGVCIMSAYAKG